MNEDLRKMIHDAPIPWDEVRERRVLSRVEEALAQRRAAVPPRATKPALLWGGAAVAAAAAAVLAVWGFSRIQPEPVQSEPVAVEQSVAQTPALTIPDQAPPTMALADGSVATLHDAARVDVDVQTEDLVRLLQHNGVVRYEVAPNPARRFVVDAQGVEVRVIGTVFTVKVASDRVTVNVERGKVAVESSERMAELTAGDEISLDIEPEETLVVLEEEPSDPPVNGPRSRPKAKAAPAPSVDELLRKADSARGGGRLAEAAATLSELVRRYPKDPRTYSSYFQLAKVERARGHHGAAASAFAACYKRAPKGSLSEDARAEAAVSWLDAGQKSRAGKAARSYLERHPQGAHTDRMRRILTKLQ